MARVIPAHGYDALEPEHFANLDDRQAELLVRDLLAAERADRHAIGSTLEGPPPRSVGGTDHRLALAAPPLVSRADYQRSHGAPPLTFDEVGLPVVYSVKTGSTAKRHFLSEAAKGSAWAVAALQSGGRLVIVMTEPKVDAPTPARRKKKGAKPTKPKKAKKKPFVTALKQAYRDRMRQAAPKCADPSARIEVIDCNDLRDYLRAIRPPIARPLVEALGITWVPGLLDMPGWLDDHRRDRTAPDYVWDAARETCRDALLSALRGADAAARRVWLIAPPGVGKTRLVAEALRKDTDLDSRSFIATQPSYAIAAMREHDLLQIRRRAILVVDDCAEDDVAELDRVFAQGNHEGTASLILITPMSADAVTAQGPPAIAKLTLDPMSAGASQSLIAGEAGLDPTDESVGALARLTEGYPWFSVLVARELAKDPTRPPPRELRDAVDLALAPLGKEHDAEVERRAAALFAVMLTEGEIVLDLDKADREALTALFPCFASWAELRRAIRACAKRGLLREGDGGVLRYVTPAIVEREVALRFLGPSGPGGPPFDTRLARERMQGRYQRLLERLEKLGIAASVLADLADPLAERLEEAAHTPDGLASLSTSEISFAARHQPVRAAAALRRVIEATSKDELRDDRRSRRGVMFALGHLAGRMHTFTDVEAALFRLACAENESYANNATATWSALFDIELNQTYLTFDERVPFLATRLGSSNVEEQLVALNALARALSIHTFKLVGDPRDGAYPETSRATARTARAELWRLLCAHARAQAEGADARVVARVGAIAASELRTAARTGVVGVAASELARIIARFEEPQLRRLREAVDLVEEYDRRLVDGNAEWAALRSALSPRSYRDVLRRQVGAFGRAMLEEAEARDRAIAIEGLRPPAPLLDELDWLASDDAARAIPFAIALGSVDASAVVREGLFARAQRAPDLMSAYLRGQREGGREALADDTIAKLRAADATAEAAVVAIWRVRSSPQRLAWLLEDLERGRVAERALGFFAIGGWDQDLSSDELRHAARCFLAHDSPASIRVAVGWLANRLRSNGADADLALLLLDAFRRASRAPPTGHFAYTWEVAGDQLIASGHAGAVAEAAVRANAQERDGLPRPEVLSLLGKAAARAPEATWTAVRGILEGDPLGAQSFAIAARDARLVAHLETSVLLRWVGSDVGRATTLAVMVMMHDGPSPPAIARELIARFGPRSRPAATLAAELHTTPRAVGSLAQFAAEQVERLDRWTHDPDPGVRAFAEEQKKELGLFHDQAAAREEYERRRLGS